jgi:CheY-like chemotaxis protein
MGSTWKPLSLAVWSTLERDARKQLVAFLGQSASVDVVAVVDAVCDAHASHPDIRANPDQYRFELTKFVNGYLAHRAHSRARRILLVEDHEDTRELLAEILRDAGHVVRTAEDGPSALAVMTSFDAEIAILDIGLPNMDGYELAGHLRARLGAAAPRLVALTGYADARDRLRSQKAGFAAHLTKPVDIARLLSAVQELPSGLESDGGTAPRASVRR